MKGKKKQKKKTVKSLTTNVYCTTHRTFFLWSYTPMVIHLELSLSQFTLLLPCHSYNPVIKLLVIQALVNNILWRFHDFSMAKPYYSINEIFSSVDWKWNIQVIHKFSHKIVCEVDLTSLLSECKILIIFFYDFYWPWNFYFKFNIYSSFSRPVWLFVGCLTSQQHASVSQRWICKGKFTCCDTKIEVEDQTFYLTQSQCTDTGPTSPSADPIMPGAWQGGHWSSNFLVTGMTRPRKYPGASGIRTQDLPLSRRMPWPLGQQGSHLYGPWFQADSIFRVCMLCTSEFLKTPAVVTLNYTGSNKKPRPRLYTCIPLHKQ